MTRRLLLSISLIAWASVTNAQGADPYEAPRTIHGHPDFQGLWTTGFSTMMERPEGVQDLVVSEEVAGDMARMVHGNFAAGNTDPEFTWIDPLPLTRVRGEYRTSIVTVPEDGLIPFNQNGLQVMTEYLQLVEGGVDGPEERPLEERCLASMVYPPIHPLPLELPITIVQNENHLILFMEDAAGFRLIRIGEGEPGEEKRRFQGYSVANWEGDTLVVNSTHFRGDYPARLNVPRFLLVGSNTTITERFTRVSEAEINYQFTVNDDEFYSEPWSGEFTLRPLPGISYEYGCHEGNYSLPGILSGGRVQQIENGN